MARRIDCVLIAPLAMTAAVQCQAQQLTFKDKTITVLIAFEPGGPYDLYGRLLARHIGSFLPGMPTVVVQNMAGAGGVIGINYLNNVAPKDGTTIGVVSQTVAIGQVLGIVSGLKYDVRSMNWIGRLNSNVEVQFSFRNYGYSSFDVARQREVVVAGTGPTSSSNLFPKLLNETIGTKFKVVTGYQGPASAQLAMERGEVGAIVKPWSSIKAMESEKLKSGEIVLNMQYSVTRHPELQNVPAVLDVAQTSEQRDLFRLFASGSSLGTSVVAPPGVPAATSEVLRQAMATAMNSAEFRADAARLSMDLDFLEGAKVQKVVAATFDVAPETLERARNFVRAISQ